jgi:ATP synthase protein I
MINNKEKNDSNNLNKVIKDLAPYMGLGLQLAVTVTVMVFLGIWLDKQFNSSPYLTIISSFIGVFAALYEFIKTVIKQDDEKRG